MSKELKAIPTEYKGVVYRSKSEAMFARYRELYVEHFTQTGYIIGGGFTYEPEEFVLEWRPDFYVWELFKQTETVMPRIEHHLIEYKPKSPTKTYLRQWEEKAKDTVRWILENQGIVVIARLFCGSVFNRDRSIIDAYKDGSVHDWKRDWLAGWEDDIKATRFDLEAC